MKLEDCCYTCTRHGHKVCRDDNPSPLETERICADCLTDDEQAAA